MGISEQGAGARHLTKRLRKSRGQFCLLLGWPPTHRFAEWVKPTRLVLTGCKHRQGERLRESSSTIVLLLSGVGDADRYMTYAQGLFTLA